MSGRGINVEGLLLEVLLEGANVAGCWHVAITIGPIHEANTNTDTNASASALLDHTLFPLAHQTKHAEYQASGQSGSNATQCRKDAARQLEQLARRAALLLGLIEAAGTVVMTCKETQGTLIENKIIAQVTAN